MNKDITYCDGIECPFRKGCERYTGNHDFGDDTVSRFVTTPIIWNPDGTAYCEYIKKRHYE